MGKCVEQGFVFSDQLTIERMAESDKFTVVGGAPRLIDKG